MLNKQEAKKLVEQAWPNTKAVACVPYGHLYIVRVEYASIDEKNYDPFFSVNPHTKEVREFSIMSDGDPLEIAAAFNASS